METGLFEIQAKHLREYRQNRQVLRDARGIIHSFSEQNTISACPAQAYSINEIGGPAFEFARCFLRLANLPNFALDRLSRYETSLWRQAGQILFALEALDRRKPQERTRPL
jgi:hypothetical protein